jgi:hypothetical protein
VKVRLLGMHHGGMPSQQSLLGVEDQQWLAELALRWLLLVFLRLVQLVLLLVFLLLVQPSLPLPFCFSIFGLMCLAIFAKVIYTREGKMCKILIDFIGQKIEKPAKKAGF